ncbi:chemotaxis protein CheD [Aurantimonas sp. Leaf443]|uniref:chemotaxis protein CheD n=1 Tax=Aurantimonas sp. Leaf443 TaxID=1736378 RepID=UPI001FCD9199|nr:chemotaxis protein CheD [Aurantimonas sp. Leaf443]
MLTAVLGSCIAACIHDPVAQVGGMNHFLLAGGDGRRSRSQERYGASLMEVLINGLLARGATRDNLQAKVFGGSSMIPGMGDIGRANAIFASNFLLTEGIMQVGGSVGGISARLVEYWPETGRARQKFVQRVVPVVDVAPPAEEAGLVEFF